MPKKKQSVKKQSVKIEPIIDLPKPVKKVTIESAGIVDGVFEVILSNGDILGGVDEIATKRSGYGNNLYVHIYCTVDQKLNQATVSDTPVKAHFNDTTKLPFKK